MQVNLLCLQPRKMCFSVTLLYRNQSWFLSYPSSEGQPHTTLRGGWKTPEKQRAMCMCVWRVGWMEGEKVGGVTARSLGRKSEVWGKDNGTARGGKEKYEGSFRRGGGERDGGGERVRGRCVERGVWEKSICSLERLEETISPVWPSSPLGVRMCVYVCVQVHACVCGLCVYMCFNSQMPVCVYKRHACTLILSSSRFMRRYVQPGMCGCDLTCVCVCVCVSLSPPVFAVLSSNMFYWHDCWGAGETMPGSLMG